MKTYVVALLFISFLFSACSTVVKSAPVAIPTPLLPPTALPHPQTQTAFPPRVIHIRRPTITIANTGTPIASLTPFPPFVYVFPLQPSGVATYGEGVLSHGYPATDIFAPIGTKFVAVTRGVVEFVSDQDQWNPEQNDPALRGGLAVAIIGYDGVRYYGSHLLAIAPGIYTGLYVETGQLLGYVGASGDAAGKESHLHFGISLPTFPEDWEARRGQVDPFPYLKAWESGSNLIPGLP